MPAATQIFYPDFDHAFFKLPPDIQKRIGAKLDQLGQHLEQAKHFRLTDSADFRLRVGDYRVIYGVDFNAYEIHVYAVGKRSEIYRRRQDETAAPPRFFSNSPHFQPFPQRFPLTFDQ